ncbi:plastocyanin/azurin family copper-binding protein [Devosia sp.]|uniref:plastocyanin/azurin family copper-binding protein n=1 Tax=Devosia sp. TaxID=1871048 RepID=UPI002AFF5BA1|nr:plastocyanin/azurin family copper-binding protein [Devosia sp.]
MTTRRLFLGAAAATLIARPLLAVSEEVVEISMGGRADGSHVWFDPIGLLVPVGATLRWTNKDPGNAHTSTAYHPSIFERQARIPEGATPWDSDYLLPGESFTVTLTIPGIYDFYCVPHEHAGMVGRIVVGEAGPGYPDIEPDAKLTGLPDIALANLPNVDAILASGCVRKE